LGPQSFVGLEASEKIHELDASKLPLKGVRLSVREFFVETQLLFDFREAGEVVGCEHLGPVPTMLLPSAK